MSQLDQFELDAVFGCWPHTGKFGSNGRPIVWRGRTPVSAYKVAYEAAYGPVPDGLELEHTCKNLACCRPSHFMVVTRERNEQLKSWRARTRIATCPHGGHDLKLYGVITPWGGRVCRQCNKETER